MATYLVAAAYRTLRRYRLRAADADDVVQAALLAATRSLPTFRGRTGDQLLLWFGAILRHHAAGFIRADQRRQLLERAARGDAEPAAPEADDPDIVEELLGHLREAMSWLPRRQRFVLEQYFDHRQSLDAIGEALGITANAPRLIKARALARLRSLLCGGGVKPVTRRSGDETR